MHKRAVFNFGEFKSRKCFTISFSRDYSGKWWKNKKALKNQGFSWLYLFYSPFWLRGWDLNLMVLTNSLRRICLRSPRGSDVPPAPHSLPLGRSLCSLPAASCSQSKRAIFSKKTMRTHLDRLSAELHCRGDHWSSAQKCRL